MAKLFPERIPENVRSDPKRNAECEVYDALATLHDPYTIFYSVAWQARINGQIRDGEADFVIAHPIYGILVVEVKGGGIGFDPNTDEWISTDREGQAHRITNPFEQAKKSQHTLLDKLQDLPEWDRRRFLTIGHIIVFPHVVVKNDLGLDKNREIILDMNDLKEIENSIQKAFNYFKAQYHGEGTLGSDRLSLVKNALANAFTLDTPLGNELGVMNARLVQLTIEQYHVLDLLKRQRRVAISGCAGSGKTMLALEKANRLADQGFQVLLTCFNFALALYLRQYVHENVTVFHFHGLCEDLAKNAGFSLKNPVDQNDFYNNTLPEILMDVVGSIGPQFDAIIVDEGQDFRDNWWIALASTLKDPDGGIFYIFFDDNQNIFQVNSSFGGLISTESFELTINCRNTQAIHKIVAKFHDHPENIECMGPVGIQPEIILYSGQTDLKSQVQSKLHQLVKNDSIAASDIVILTPKSQENSIFKTGTTMGNFSLSLTHPMRQGQIQATSVYRFKGLESLVILMVELDESVHHELEKVIYVGCSRAKTHLILFIEKGFPDDIQLKLMRANK